MKSFFKTLALLVGLAAVVWIGMYLYWHIRIQGALRTMETGCVPTTTEPGYTAPGDAVMVLKDAGCRALSHLAGSLDPSKNPAFLAATSKCFIEEVNQAGKSKPNADLAIKSDDSAAERQRKCDALRRFWQTREKDLHKGWKVWSDRCVD